MARRMRQVEFDVFTPTKALFKSWSAWCGERNMRAGTERAFSDTLSGKPGYRRDRKNSVRGFNSIALIEGGETQTEAKFGESET